MGGELVELLPEIDTQDRGDFKITAVRTLKHAVLYALAKRFGSQAKLAEAIGASPTCVCRWIGLREFPSRDGKFISALESLAGMSYDQLFPEYIKAAGLLAGPKKEERALSVSCDGGGGLLLGLESNYETPEQLAIELESAESVRNDLRQLTYREREIIKMRYGFDEHHCHTLEECGRAMRITRERVRQIEAKAVRRLQQMNGRWQ